MALCLRHRYDEEIVPGADPLWSTQLTNIQGFHAILFQDQPTIVFTDDTDHMSRVIWRLPNGTWFDSGHTGLGNFGTFNYPCTLTILLNRLYLFCFTGMLKAVLALFVHFLIRYKWDCGLCISFWEYFWSMATTHKIQCVGCRYGPKARKHSF